uniref:Uncharacterized protein n=1 Tax=Plectus sambesii TaxID=2011161 RepID=A0A914UZK9_9BILA
MNRAYSADPTDKSKKEEECRTPYEKLLNDSDEDQDGDAPIQMQFKEEMYHQASVYSLFHLIDEDEDGKASIQARKKVTRLIFVCVGFLAVILILTALVFTLFYTSLVEKKNITSSSDSTITEVPSILGNTSDTEFRGTIKKLQNKEMQMHNIIWDGCITKVKALINRTWKLSHGTEKLQNKKMQKLNINLDGCIKKVEVCLIRMKKLLNGDQLNKDMQGRNTTWDRCIILDTAWISLTKKPSGGTDDQQNREMQMRNITLDGCTKKNKETQAHNSAWEFSIGTAMVCLSHTRKLLNGTEKLLIKETRMRKTILDGCIIMDEACLNLILKQSNGTEKLLIKEMRMRTVT